MGAAIVAGHDLEILVTRQDQVQAAGRALANLSGAQPFVDAEARQVSVPVSSHGGILTRAVRELDAAGIEVDDIGFRRPTLDEVFLSLTGRPATDEGSVPEELAS